MDSLAAAEIRRKAKLESGSGPSGGRMDDELPRTLVELKVSRLPFCLTSALAEKAQEEEDVLQACNWLLWTSARHEISRGKQQEWRGLKVPFAVYRVVALTGGDKRRAHATMPRPSRDFSLFCIHE